MLKKVFIAFAILCAGFSYVAAEEITLTTYYPSPRGVYSELKAGTINSTADTPYEFDLNEGNIVAKEMVLIDDVTGEKFGLRISDRKMYVVDYASKRGFLMFEFPSESEAVDLSKQKRMRR